MKQEIRVKNEVDEKGNPAGGTVRGIGIQIDWQNGPLGRGADRMEPNGAFVEGVLEAVRQRMEFYECSEFSCPQNTWAMHHIQMALHWLEARTANREMRQVEGTHMV